MAMVNLKPSPIGAFTNFFVIAIALGVMLRIIQLGNREFWYDEVLSLLLSTGNKGLYQTPGDTPVLLSTYRPLLSLPPEHHWGESLATLGNVIKGILAEPHPPLFFLEQHFWLRLWGNSEAAMRSLIALFSLGAIYCAYGLGRCLLGQQGGLLLAALLSLNPYYFFHSLNVRMYGSLVFWVLLTGWAWAVLIQESADPSSDRNSRPRFHWNGWWLILTLGTAGGLLTFYYFAIWILTLALGVRLWDRRRWGKYAIALGLGILLNLPWWWWGTRQQLRNADLARFSKALSFGESLLSHGQDLVQTLGIHLLIGDWASSSPDWLINIAGLGAIVLLLGSIVLLWRGHQRHLLAVGLLLGLFPLGLMLAIDVLKGQYTLGFGWGRSVIFVLPGCLLLLAAGIQATKARRNAIAIGLLLLYLSINLADISLRSRQMFQQMAAYIPTHPPQSTLIALNSPAWGHVLRFAYYLPAAASVELLAQKSAQLPEALNHTLTSQDYNSVLWLDSARPIWGAISTEAQRQQIQQILTSRYPLKQQQSLTGTSKLDNFLLHFYTQQPDRP